jgi:hypothetical protein
VTSELHTEIDTPNWTTKVRCSCGFESVSRCEWALHAAPSLRAEVERLTKENIGLRAKLHLLSRDVGS